MRLAAEAVLLAVLLAASASSSAGAATRTLSVSAPQHFVLYSSFQEAQYSDHADDRARGAGHNPFGNSIPSYAAPTTNERVYGPLTGDAALYAFKLYSDTSLKASVGSSIFFCQYNFSKNGFCDAAFQLQGGSVIGEGAFNLHAETFTLAIVGGTKQYRDVTGLIQASLSPTGTATQPESYANAPGIIVEPQRLSFVVQPLPAGGGPRAIDAYSFPVEDAYLNHNDDEARGDAANPFGTLVYKQCLALPHSRLASCDAAVMKAAATTIDAHNDGPFPGDDTMFGFKLYKSAAFKGQTGSAVLTCQYYFDHYAFCDASFQMKSGGTLIGQGTFSFDAKSFSLAITGGYGTFAGVTGGEVDASPAGNFQHLVFTLG
jgi:hypothetical protein